jgi:hypothetical protein
MAGTGCPPSATAKETFFVQTSGGEAGVCPQAPEAAASKQISTAGVFMVKL